MRKVFAIWLLITLAVVGYGAWLRYGQTDYLEQRYRADIATVAEMKPVLTAEMITLGKAPRANPAPYLASYDQRKQLLEEMAKNLPENKGSSGYKAVQVQIRAGERANDQLAAYIKERTPENKKNLAAAISQIKG